LTHAGEKDDKGFKPLFNGKNLDGWKTEGNWLVEKDGVLAIKPRPGEKGWQRYGSYLWTDRKYGDFVLDLEYKHPKGGNSGVFVRVKELKNPVDTGIEVQILDSYGHKGKLTHHDNGGIIRTSAPSKNASKPAGEWNRMTITCKGNNLEVVLNGEKVNDVDLSKGPMKDRPMEGYVGLQDHGELLWFRNIRLKELSKGE
jgi:hypothetical protein